MPEPWYKYALEEIDLSRKTMTPFEIEFIKSIRQRAISASLTNRQEKTLLKIHERLTDIRKS
jgi:hypothetical protein